MGLKEQLAGVKDGKEEIVRIEEWGLDVMLKEPTAGEALRFAKKQEAGGLDAESLAWEILALCIYDEDGRVFVDTFDGSDGKSGKHIAGAKHCEAALSDKSVGAVTKLSKACQALMGFNVDAAAKNSEETTAGSSSTD